MEQATAIMAIEAAATIFRAVCMLKNILKSELPGRIGREKTNKSSVPDLERGEALKSAISCFPRTVPILDKPFGLIHKS